MVNYDQNLAFISSLWLKYHFPSSKQTHDSNNAKTTMTHLSTFQQNAASKCFSMAGSPWPHLVWIPFPSWSIMKTCGSHYGNTSVEQTWLHISPLYPLCGFVMLKRKGWQPPKVFRPYEWAPGHFKSSHRFPRNNDSQTLVEKRNTWGAWVKSEVSLSQCMFVEMLNIFCMRQNNILLRKCAFWDINMF